MWYNAKKFMSTKKPAPIVILVVVGILVVVFVGVWYLFSRIGREAGPERRTEFRVQPGEPGTPTPESTQTLEVNFFEAGNILNWDPETESYTEDWTLLYEKPGAPALSVKLIFDGNSVCVLGKGEWPCDQVELNNGDRVELQGNRVGDEVTVIRLRKFPEE